MATINFGSNQNVQGTSSDDLMTGNDLSGNNNDTIYGHLGNDTINAQIALNNSTAYGGQGNDVILGNNSNFLYGNQGNDAIEVLGNPSTSAVASSDALYGGQGDDYLFTFFSSSDVLYGNQGNDTLFMVNDTLQVAYGGQGNDSVEQAFSAVGAEYGNQGNDLVEDVGGTGLGAAENGSGTAEGSSVLYGGQGDDILTALGAGGDTMYGGLGANLFAGNAFLGTGAFTANDMITVGDFATGVDRLSLSNSIGAQQLSANANGFLTKEDDPSAANATDATADANAFFGSGGANGGFLPQYLFVYGGSGAGYLFYDGDNGSLTPTDGMILAGQNGEGSLQASDIVASNFAA